MGPQVAEYCRIGYLAAFVEVEITGIEKPLLRIFRQPFDFVRADKCYDEGNRTLCFDQLS